MGQECGRPERHKADKQVTQQAHHFVVLADQQQPDQRQSQRQHQPAGVDAGQEPDPGGPGLKVGGDGDHVDDHHRHQKDSGHASAVSLEGQRLEVVACHRADLGGDGLDHSEQGRDQQRHPGQLVARGSPDARRPCQRWSGRCPTLPITVRDRCCAATPPSDVRHRLRCLALTPDMFAERSLRSEGVGSLSAYRFVHPEAIAAPTGLYTTPPIWRHRIPIGPTGHPPRAIARRPAGRDPLEGTWGIGIGSILRGGRGRRARAADRLGGLCAGRRPGRHRRS